MASLLLGREFISKPSPAQLAGGHARKARLGEAWPRGQSAGVWIRRMRPLSGDLQSHSDNKGNHLSLQTSLEALASLPGWERRRESGQRQEKKNPCFAIPVISPRGFLQLLGLPGRPGKVEWPGLLPGHHGASSLLEIQMSAALTFPVTYFISETVYKASPPCRSCFSLNRNTLVGVRCELMITLKSF